MDAIDTNFQLIATDFVTLQKAINKMHECIIDLQEINKDVLLGRRNANCISCSKGQDGFEKIEHVQGKDGKLYYA